MHGDARFARLSRSLAPGRARVRCRAASRCMADGDRARGTGRRGRDGATAQHGEMTRGTGRDDGATAPRARARKRGCGFIFISRPTGARAAKDPSICLGPGRALGETAPAVSVRVRPCAGGTDLVGRGLVLCSCPLASRKRSCFGCIHIWPGEASRRPAIGTRRDISMDICRRRLAIPGPQEISSNNRESQLASCVAFTGTHIDHQVYPLQTS